MGVATVIAGATLVAGAVKAISGAKQKRDAKRSARRFVRREAKNTQTGRAVSTLGADLAREEQARATASNTEALASGGVRGSVGGIGGVQEANNDAARRIGANLDTQQQRIDEAIANDEVRVQQAQQSQDTQDLNNIQQQQNAGNEQMWSGIGDVASGIGGMASGGAFGGNSARGANPQSQSMPSKDTLDSAFGSYGAAFGSNKTINPITGRPYGT